MSLWNIKYFPASGERNSPYDVIRSLTNTGESASIMHRLGVMRKTDVGDWPQIFKVHKVVDKVYQLPAGDWRVMYFLDNRTIVVIHVCRKVKGKTLPKDTRRAEIHYNRYMLQKKGR